MLKNITLSADEGLLRKAREKAAREKKSLNAVFREWIKRYVGLESSSNNYQVLMEKLIYVKAGSKFSRQEMNER